MTPQAAHAILNAAKAGQAIPLAQINEALFATGDLQLPERRYTPSDSSPSFAQDNP